MLDGMTNDESMTKRQMSNEHDSTWKRFKAALAHAFDYDDGREEVSEEDIALLDRMADFVVRRRMTLPAMLVLETVTPLNFVGSSAMTFFRPIFGLLFSTKEYERIERLLEKRCSLALLIERIELRERERDGAAPGRPATDGPTPDADPDREDSARDDARPDAPPPDRPPSDAPPPGDRFG